MSDFNADLIRQGDVLVQRVDAIPDGCTELPRDAGRIVLAYGEVTGHAHAIHERDVTMLRAANADVYLRVVEPSMLRHEEHTHIAIPPGLYRVVRQREWTDDSEPRQVAD